MSFGIKNRLCTEGSKTSSRARAGAAHLDIDVRVLGEEVGETRRGEHLLVLRIDLQRACQGGELLGESRESIDEVVEAPPHWRFAPAWTPDGGLLAPSPATAPAIPACAETVEGAVTKTRSPKTRASKVAS